MISPTLARQLDALVCCQEREPHVTVWLPVTTHNPANGSHGHWAPKAARNKAHRSAAFRALKAHTWRKCPGGVVVRLVRQSPRALDDDNCARALKSIRDGCADALGVDDRDPRVRWVVDQQKGKAAGVVIELYEVH